MLKCLMMLFFLIPLCFISNMWWLVQSILFVVTLFFLFSNVVGTFFCNMGYFMGCDVLSYGLILLSLWICVLMMTASESIYRFKNYEGFFMLMILSLMIFLYLTLSTTNLFFESSLIPTLFMILGWGYQPQPTQ